MAGENVSDARIAAGSKKRTTVKMVMFDPPKVLLVRSFAPIIQQPVLPQGIMTFENTKGFVQLDASGKHA